MADDIRLPSMGDKSFSAVTDQVRPFTDSAAEVNKLLVSVPRMVAAVNTVVVDVSGSYVVHKESGEWFPLVVHGRVHTLKMWVPGNQSNAFL